MISIFLYGLVRRSLEIEKVKKKQKHLIVKTAAILGENSVNRLTWRKFPRLGSNIKKGLPLPQVIKLKQWPGFPTLR